MWRDMKLKVVRLVTEADVILFHMQNTLKRMSTDFEVCVVGSGVSRYRAVFPNMTFVDITITRKPNLLADLRALIALCKLYRYYQPDIVHSIMPKAGLLSALAGCLTGVPIRLHTFTGQVWAAQSGWSRRIYRLVDKIITALNTTCTTDSFSQSAFLFENGISKKGLPLPVLCKGSLSGVDPDRFNLQSMAAEANILRTKLRLDQKFVFTFIARKTRDKGAVDILKAFSLVAPTCEEARLLFVGPDEDGEIDRLGTVHPELFVNVTNIGQVVNHEIFLAITDVLCLPSYREGFGSIVIDAAAMQVPTIGSRIPGLTDSIVDGKTGLLFAPGNLNELVEHMRHLFENPALRQEMGAAAKARVDEVFTADLLYAALKDFYLSFSPGRWQQFRQ